MRSSKARVVLGFVRGAGALALCLVAGFRVVSAAEVTLATKEVSLGNLPPGSIRLAVSPDSKRVGYVAQRGGQRLLVGREVLLLGGKWLVVLDGVEGRQYDGIGKGSPVFSPDSKRLAYGAVRGNNQLVVVDGVEGKEYDGVGPPVFSPDSKRVAFGAGRARNQLVVVDGVEAKEYDGIEAGNLVFSADSKRVAYVAGRADKDLVVLDGVEEKEYDGIGARGLVFSPDSKRVAYGAGRPKQLVVMRPVEVYLAGKQLVVVDGVEGKEYDSILKGTLVFSADSKRVAYVAERYDKDLVVVDGVEGKEYDLARAPVFSPDSKRVVYEATRGGKWLVVVDGVEGKEYDGFLKGREPVFDSPSQLHALALRGGEFLRVEVEIVMPSAEPSGAPRPPL